MRFENNALPSSIAINNPFTNRYDTIAAELITYCVISYCMMVYMLGCTLIVDQFAISKVKQEKTFAVF